jgi:delta-aminolevulinic acid dehydratase/porphobilinogen synthase
MPKAIALMMMGDVAIVGFTMIFASRFYAYFRKAP